MKKKKKYYNPVRVNKLWSSNYIKYKSNIDENKILSVEECFNRIRPYLKEIINNLKKSNTGKVQLAIVNTFISSIYNDD